MRKNRGKGSKPNSQVTLNDLGEEEAVSVAVPFVRRILKSRIFGVNDQRKEVLDIGFDQEKRQLTEVLRKCIEFGESNSAILMGPRGVGKSILLESALNELKALKDNYFLISLNGFVQTDDRVALQEIARQLQLENVLGDRVYGSFADNLAFILESLKQGNKGTKSVVFILDEFDLFAMHKNQSLIYNLLDVAQFKQCPAAVIGVTCRLDVLELLEKRVKSRYSHRCILVYSSRSFEDYVQMFKDLLTLPISFEYSDFREAWQKKLDVLAQDPKVLEDLRHMFNKSKEISGLLQCLALPVCHLSTKHWFLRPQDIAESVRKLRIDTKTVMLKGLSVLELCLVVAMQHISDKYEGDPFNFEVVFDEYARFTQKHITTFKVEKAVALKAMEHLISVEIVKVLDSPVHASLPKEFKSLSLLVDRSQILDTVDSYTDCPTELGQWAKSMFA